MDKITLLMWASSFLNILGCVLNARKNLICWPIWVGTAIFNSWYFIFYRTDYAVGALWIFYIFIDLYGWINWRRHETPKG